MFLWCPGIKETRRKKDFWLQGFGIMAPSFWLSVGSGKWIGRRSKARGKRDGNCERMREIQVGHPTLLAKRMHSVSGTLPSRCSKSCRQKATTQALHSLQPKALNLKSIDTACSIAHPKSTGTPNLRFRVQGLAFPIRCQIIIYKPNGHTCASVALDSMIVTWSRNDTSQTLNPES